METKGFLLLGIGAAALYLLIPRKARAAGGLLIGEVETETIPLIPISGANWTMPIYMTLERDLRFGQWGWIATAGTATMSALGTAASAVGNAIGTAFTWGNNILQGTVIPAVVSFGGKTAEVLKATPGWLWTGAKTVAGTTYDIFKSIGTGAQWVGEQAWTGTKEIGKGIAWVGQKTWEKSKLIGSKVWDTLTGANNPAVQAGKQTSLLTQALGVVAATGATVFAAKQGNISNTTNNPASTAPNTIAGQTTSESILLGYASKSNFEGALQLNKMYNPNVKDTLIMTDPEGLDVAQKAGYQLMAKLGFCAPTPFEGCVPLVRFFNPNTVDHLVISNPEAGPSLEQIGYQSQGSIGYIKAAA